MTKRSDKSGTVESREWFVEWFNHPLYLEVYRHRNKDEAVRCIKTILSISGLDQQNPATISVLDIACGAGRHALELSRLGYCVTGNDLSPFLLEEARKEAVNCNLNLQFTCCDMRQIPGDGNIDLVVQLFTSFGYFSSREDDLLVLSKVFDAMKSGGWYVLDLINPVHLERNLVAHSSRTAGNLTLVEERTLENERITKNITITSPLGETLNFSESVRLFSREEILLMLQKSGFSVTSISGDYHGNPFSEKDSPRMMLFCRKS
jgi:SAM-dependent methyltransferase